MKLIKNTFIRYMMIAALTIFTIRIILIFPINQYIISSTRDHILSSPEIDPTRHNDCILNVNNDRSLSLMLNERLEKNIELYYQNTTPKLILLIRVRRYRLTETRSDQ